MKVSQALQERRAVKHFDPAHEMSEAEIVEFFESVILAPTSFNLQHWRFVLVQDKQQREQLREAAWNQAQITEASLAIVLCADLKTWEKTPEKYWRNAPQEAQDILIPMIKPFYEGKEELQRDEAMRSVGIAAQSIMLLAKEKGLDSCPMIGFDQEKVAQLIDLPRDHAIGMIVTVGKATKPAWPKPGQLDLNEVLIRGKF